MNTTLPPPRDLPPHAHARIRGRLESVVTRRRRAWFAPALSGVAALVLIAFFTWPAPTPGEIDRTPVSTGPEGQRPAPHVPGVSPTRQAQIEKNCAQVLGVRDAVLYQVIEDAAGQGALLYTPDGVGMECQLGEPGFPYNPVDGGVGPLDWLPGPMSYDVGYRSGGGDLGDGSAAGRAGWESLAGRITSEVARVTYSVSGATHRAEVANGTYYLRIVHPGDWELPPLRLGALRAYDADGELLATLDLEQDHPVCLRLPDGKVSPEGVGIDPDTCRDAVPWR